MRILHRGWVSLQDRPLEAIYFACLLLHFLVLAGVCVQPLYPDWLVSLFPQFLRDIPENWIALSGDPFRRSLIPGWKGRVNEFTWFWANTVWLEGWVLACLTKV
jgi:hypothetical protein